VPQIGVEKRLATMNLAKQSSLNNNNCYPLKHKTAPSIKMNCDPIQEEADLSDDGLVRMKRLKHRVRAQGGQEYVNVIRPPQHKKPPVVPNKKLSWKNRARTKQETRQDIVPDREAIEAAERVGAAIDALQLDRQSSSFSDLADRYAITNKTSTMDGTLDEENVLASKTVDSAILASRTRDPFDPSPRKASGTLIDDVTTASVDDDIYQDELTLNHSYMRQAKNFNYFLPNLCGAPSHGLAASESHDYSHTITSELSGTFVENVESKDTLFNGIDLSKSGDTLFNGLDQIPSVASSDHSANDNVPLLSRSEMDSPSSPVAEKTQRRNMFQRVKSKSVRQLNFFQPNSHVEEPANADPSVAEAPAGTPEVFDTEPSLDNLHSEKLDNVPVEVPSKKSRFQRAKSNSLNGMNGFFTAKEPEGQTESAVDKRIVDRNVSPEKKQNQASRWSSPFRNRRDDESVLSPQSLLFSDDEEGFDILLPQKASSKKVRHSSPFKGWMNRGSKAAAPQRSPNVDISAKATSESGIVSDITNHGALKLAQAGETECVNADLSISNVVNDSSTRARSTQAEPIPKPKTVMKLPKLGLKSLIKKMKLKKLAGQRREKPVSSLSLEPCTAVVTEVDACLTSPEDLANPKTLVTVAKKKVKRRNSSFKSAPLTLLPSIGETTESEGSANSRQVTVAEKAENFDSLYSNPVTEELVDVPFKDFTMEASNLLDNTIDDDDSLGDWLRQKEETEEAMQTTGWMSCYGVEEPVDRFTVPVEEDESVQVSTNGSVSVDDASFQDEVPDKAHAENKADMQATSYFLCCSFGTRRSVVEATKAELGSEMHFDDSPSQGTQSTDDDDDTDEEEGPEGQDDEFDEVINAYSIISTQFPDNEIEAIRTMGDETYSASDETNLSIHKAVLVIKKHAAMNGVTEQELVEVLAYRAEQQQSDDWLVEVGEATDEFFDQVAAYIRGQKSNGARI
jgi:hypothetical protein